MTTSTTALPMGLLAVLVAACSTAPTEIQGPAEEVGAAAEALSVSYVSKVTGQPGSLNADDNQAESVVSVNRDASGNRVVTVTYNDGSPAVFCTPWGCSELDNHIEYTPTTRKIFHGASSLGWSYSTDDGVTWIKRGPLTPPAGWAVVWGDPAISRALPPSTSPDVYITNIAISDAAFPAGANAFISGSVTSFVDGGCIARSIDGGKNFTIMQCVTDNGHFYDGSSVAVGGTNGPVYAAWRDVDADQIDVWQSPGGGLPFVQIPSPPIVAHTHPRIRVYEGLLYVASQQVSVDGLTGTVRMSIWNGSTWSTAKSIITAAFQPNVLFSAHAVRTGPQFSFDIANYTEISGTMPGSCTTNAQCQSAVCDGTGTCLAKCVSGTCKTLDKLRLAYTFRDAQQRLKTGVVACDRDLLACVDVPEWSTAAHAGDQYNPVMSAFRGQPFVAGADWHMAYQSRASDPTGNSVTLRHARINLLPNNDVIVTSQDVHPYQQVCPDLRAGASGYWGDYNDIAWLGFTETGNYQWIATFTDSSDGCSLQWDFTSNSVHVGAAVITN
jgi:hypothetical protein